LLKKRTPPPNGRERGLSPSRRRGKDPFLKEKKSGGEACERRKKKRGKLPTLSSKKEKAPFLHFHEAKESPRGREEERGGFHRPKRESLRTIFSHEKGCERTTGGGGEGKKKKERKSNRTKGEKKIRPSNPEYLGRTMERGEERGTFLFLEGEGEGRDIFGEEGEREENICKTKKGKKGKKDNYLSFRREKGKEGKKETKSCSNSPMEGKRWPLEKALGKEEGKEKGSSAPTPQGKSARFFEKEDEGKKYLDQEKRKIH